MPRAFKKIILAGFLALAVACSPLQVYSSHAFWGEFVQENYHFLLKEVHDLIRATIMGMLKQQAVESLNQEVNSTVGGSSSQNAMFITDWEDFMVKTPEKNAKKKLMNDYLSQATKGRGSSLEYAPEGLRAKRVAAGNFEGVGPGSFFYGIAADNPLYERLIDTASAEGISPNSFVSNGNYMNNLKENVRASLVEPKELEVTYEGNPSNMFNDGTFYNMSLFLSGINHPAAFNLYMRQKYEEELENEKEIARTKAVAYQGFKGTEKNGKTVNPGSVVKENVVNVQDMGNQLVVNAQHPGEFLAAFVAEYLQKSLKGEWGNMQSNLYRDTESVQRNAEREKAKEVKETGPGAMFRR